MKNLIKHFSLTLFIFLSSTTFLAAQWCTKGPDGKYYNPDGSPCTNSVLSAVPFLRIVGDARSGGMGDAGIGLSPDANALHFNASKLAFAEQGLNISATYTPWLRALGLNDVYLAYLTGYYKMDDRQAVGFGLRYFSLGSIQFTDQNGEPLVPGRPNEFDLTASYARKLSEKFSASLSARFIYSNLAAGQQVDGGEVIEPGLAGAADLSITYKSPLRLPNKDSDLTVGLAITNLGSKISYTNSIVKDYLPANIGIGAAWKIELDEYNSITFATDFNKLMVPTPCQGAGCVDRNNNGIDDYREQSTVGSIFSSFSDAPEGAAEEFKEVNYALGLEYWYDEQFAVRTGYFHEHVQKGGRQYFTVGLGLKYNLLGLNFSYLIPTTNQRNPLDNTLRFSLLFDFQTLNG
jgi:hypothetical protein